MGMPKKMAIRIALGASSNVLGSTPAQDPAHRHTRTLEGLTEVGPFNGERPASDSGNGLSRIRIGIPLAKTAFRMQADGREVVEVIEVLLPKWFVEAIAFVDDFHQFAVFLLAHHHAGRVARKNRKEKKDHRHHPEGHKERLTDLAEQFTQQSEKIQ